jgi:iron complex transport system substrate-binding protein
MVKKITAVILLLALLLALAACGSGTRDTPVPDTSAAAETPAQTAPADTPSPSPDAATPGNADTPADQGEDPNDKGTPGTLRYPEDEESTPGNIVTPASEDTRAFVDSVGRSVQIPKVINKIAVTGPVAQIVLFALAPDRMVGLATEWDDSAKEFFVPEYYALPVLGQLYGGKSELNLEELLNADPDVVIDVGEPKDGIVEDMNKLSDQTGIPFLHIDGYTATMGETYRILGELLDLPQRAQELTDYCDGIYAYAKNLGESLGDKKISALYLLGDSGLNVIAQGSFHAEMLNLLVDNAAVLDNPSGKGTGNETDMEQLLLWDPEVILFAPDSVYEKVGDDPLWQDLTAIKTGRYYRVPFGPYNWMGFPPSVQRYLGILWLAKLLYPDEAQYDLYTEVAHYFRLFYSCDLTQAQYEQLISQER